MYTSLNVDTTRILHKKVRPANDAGLTSMPIYCVFIKVRMDHPWGQ